MKAVTLAEKTICADAGLAQLDVELASLFKAALSHKVATKDEQRSWLKQRDSDCKANDKYLVACLGGVMRKRIETLRQNDLNRMVATTTTPQFPIINIPIDWWGFTPTFPEGIEYPNFREVSLRDGKIVAELYWREPGSKNFHYRWVDVVTGEVIADSASDPDLARQLQIGVASARVEPPREGGVRFEDRSRIEFYYTYSDFCGWPLNATASVFNEAGDLKRLKVLRRLANENAFHLVNTSLCPRFEHGPKHVTGHFEALNFEILFGAPDGTLVAHLFDASGTGNGNYLIRFRRDLSSPYYQSASDLALVYASDVEVVEKSGTDAPPESRFVGLDALFSKARAEADKSRP